ncbi:hypothetical protein D3C79_1075080 [compost metagenome]
MGAINQSCAGVHVDCYAEGFRDLLNRDTKLLSFSDVESNAAVAAGGYCHCKRNQLAGLRIKVVGFRAGPAQCHYALDGFW